MSPLTLPLIKSATPAIEWRQLTDKSPWGARAMPRGGLLDGYFYIISGRAGMFKIYADTWRSADGVTKSCRASWS
jgi:hypothetical protein